jgi:protein-disulfide isomerase
VIVVGAGLGSRSFGWGGSGAAASGPTGYTILYRLEGTVAHPDTATTLDAIVKILQERANLLGIAGASIEKRPPDEVAVRLPLSTDLDVARSTLGSTGWLAFVLLPKKTYGDATAPGSVALPVPGYQLDPALLATAEFTGTDLDPNSIDAAEDPSSPGHWIINLGFTSARAAAFEAWTGQHVNEYFAVTLDGQVMMAPYIKTAIVGGSFQLSSDFTEESAKKGAAFFQAGALPCPIQEMSFSQDGIVYNGQPTNGQPTNGQPTANRSSTPAPTNSAGLIVAPSATTPADIPSSGRTLGNPNAPVTIDIWIDYQCPTCRDFALQVMPQLIERYVRPGKARIVVHDMIVIDGYGGGTESAHAAIAASCAAEQGKFWQYQDWLWANQETEDSGTFSEDRLVVFAGNVGLDTQAFSQCLADGTHAAQVQAESSAAGSAGITGTPSIEVNGALVQSYDFATLSAAIEAAAASTSPR